MSSPMSGDALVLKVGRDVTDFKPGDRVAGIMPHANIHNVEGRNLVHIPDPFFIKNSLNAYIITTGTEVTSAAAIIRPQI